MKAEEFVKKLSYIAPSIERLVSRGYSLGDARLRRSNFFFEKKFRKKVEIDDPLVELICKYDTTKLEFRGGVILGQQDLCAIPPVGKSFVGTVEADLLVVDKSTGYVELLDHAQPDYVMATCAESGGQFLEALLLVASFEPPYLDLDLTAEITNEQAEKNNEAARMCAAQCAKVAGVIGQPNIYETLLGCDCWVI